MSVFWNTPLTADAILPPEWYATHTDPPAEPESEVESVVEEDDSRTEEPETEAPAQASQEEEAKPESTAAPATKAPVTTVPDTTIPDATIPGTTGSAAAVTAVPTTAPPASKSGGDNFLVNALFVVIPLLLAAILAVIGIVLVKKRGRRQTAPTYPYNGGLPGNAPYGGNAPGNGSPNAGNAPYNGGYPPQQ